jgi:hypothetical protein
MYKAGNRTVRERKRGHTSYHTYIHKAVITAILTNPITQSSVHTCMYIFFFAVAFD